MPTHCLLFQRTIALENRSGRGTIIYQPACWDMQPLWFTERCRVPARCGQWRGPECPPRRLRRWQHCSYVCAQWLLGDHHQWAVSTHEQPQLHGGGSGVVLAPREPRATWSALSLALSLSLGRPSSAVRVPRALLWSSCPRWDLLFIFLFLLSSPGSLTLQIGPHLMALVVRPRPQEANRYPYSRHWILQKPCQVHLYSCI